MTNLVDGSSKYGAFQQFSAVKEAPVAKLPVHSSFAQASVLPTCFSTALVSLSAGPGKGFGPPSSPLNPMSLDKIIGIWDTSSSIRLQVLQVARAAGITTTATASPRNLELVKGAGASLVLN